MHHLLISLSSGAVEWQPYCFAIILLHHTPVNEISVIVLSVIFRGLFLVLIYR